MQKNKKRESGDTIPHCRSDIWAIGYKKIEDVNAATGYRLQWKAKEVEMSELYEQVVVWRRLSSDEVAAYVCMRRISNRQICVQNVEFFRKTDAIREWLRLQRNLGELFLDDDIEHRCQWYEHLEDAIIAHDLEFGN